MTKKKNQKQKKTPRRQQTSAKKKKSSKQMNNKRSKSVSSIYGRVKRNPDGFGFFICEDDSVEDIYIPKERMFGVFSNDKVELKISRRSGARGKTGIVKKVLERFTDTFVGRLFYNSAEQEFFLKDTGHNWGQELYVSNPIGAKEGELVLVKITKFPDIDKKPKSNKKRDWQGTFLGEITSSIGSEVDPNTDNLRVLHECSVPIEFSEKALKEAQAYGNEVLGKDTKGRVDLRNKTLITIDGITAKDFDDAISVEKLAKGYKLIVAIADVSHYVKKDTALDKEAYNKGTSVYLANFVCPMLPEELSNGLCSLNPNVDRLCLACEINIDFSGVVQNYKFFEAVMNSKARVTYGEAQEVLEGATSEHSDKVEEMIRMAGTLAKNLNEKRMKEGSVDFDVPQIKVLVNDLGEPTDLVNEERLFAHRLIEELMLITNICAAKFLVNKKIPQLYRIHEVPEQENLIKLNKVLFSLLKVPIQKIKTSHDLQKLSEALSIFQDKHLVSIAQGYILRSMKQAQYSAKNIGHFGLGFSHYSHFTSPIRRYPDLVIHRQIKSALYQDRYKAYTEEVVAEMGTVLSAAEQRAVKAERKVISIKKARFFEHYVGQEFDGYISSVVKFGAFVTLREFPLDGLIKLEDLTGDYFIYDEEAAILKGKRTGKVFCVGDKVRIQVDHVSISDGKIDFSLVSHEATQSVKTISDHFHKASGTVRDKSKKSQKEKGSEKLSKKQNSKSSGAAALFKASYSSRGIGFGKNKKRKK